MEITSFNLNIGGTISIITSEVSENGNLDNTIVLSEEVTKNFLNFFPEENITFLEHIRELAIINT